MIDIPSSENIKTVNDWLNLTDYEFKGYMPSDEALKFIAFIKAVNDGSEENETPVVHLVMMDSTFNEDRRCAILCHRGIGKTTVFAEYLILFMASIGYFPGFGIVNLALYVTDSIENGVKNLRRNIEYRYEESTFLKKMIPNQKITIGENGQGYVGLDKYEEQTAGGRKFTDIRLEFQNINGHRLVIKGYGAKTGVRGAKEMGKRPTLSIFDDLISDADAKSAAVIAAIEDTVYKAVSKALHPKKQKMIWLGTPFNARDPLYKAVESGAWTVSVYPICEKFPCTRKEFRGSWEDRFDYDYVLAEYKEAQLLGKPENFNQELMLRIMSDEDRLIQDADIGWFKRGSILNNKSAFNFYITTDFATSISKSADFSVISVWAYNNVGDWFWVDGVCKKQLMNQNINDLFRLAQMYNPQSVGIEVSGQQGGFVTWLKEQMLERNIYFTLASENNNNKEGIRPYKDKMTRFQTILPLFKSNKMYLPIERKTSPELLECMDELTQISKTGFKSKHDDFIDTISMLSSLNAWKPSQELLVKNSGDNVYWEIEEEEEVNIMESYIV